MGRKKASRTGSDVEDIDKASSTMSIFGTSSNAEDNAAYNELEEDHFAAAAEMLYEKRAATREAGLKKLVGLLTRQWEFEECTFRQETLGNLSINCLKRGTPSESALAAQVLGLLVVTLGASPGTEAMFHNSMAVMEPVITRGSAAELQCSVIQALAMICFIAADKSEETIHVMNSFCVAFTKGEFSNEVKAAALRGWTFLFTTVAAWHMGTSFVEDHLKIISLLLYNDDVDVRLAAGEAVAIVYEMCDLCSLPKSHAHSEELHLEDGDGSAHEGLEEIVTRMQDLAKNRGDETRRSKKDRATLRRTFRELLAVIEGGESPTQKVKLRHGEELRVDTMADNVRLDAFRSFLGEGFQAHLQANTLLHCVFEFSPRSEPQGKLTPTEKRMFRSPGSAANKELTRSRNQERRMSAAYKGSMLY